MFNTQKHFLDQFENVYDFLNFLSVFGLIDKYKRLSKYWVETRSTNTSKILDGCILDLPLEMLQSFYSDMIMLQVRDSVGKSPLYISCENNNVSVVKWILDTHAKSKAFPPWNYIDGHSAYDISKKDIKQLFIDMGLVLDKNIVRQTRKTAIHFCSPVCKCLDDVVYFARPLQIY